MHIRLEITETFNGAAPVVDYVDFEFVECGGERLSKLLCRNAKVLTPPCMCFYYL